MVDPEGINELTEFWLPLIWDQRFSSSAFNDDLSTEQVTSPATV